LPRASFGALAQPARLEFALLDPQRLRQHGIVASYVLDEPLRILAADETSSESPSGDVGITCLPLAR
jgi:hypothetical protein